MPDKCLDCPAPSADMDGFIVSGPGGAPRSEGSGVSSPEGPFVREAPQTGHFILKGKVSSSSPLPDVPEPGWAYEAAEAGTYGGVQATAGDLVWCAGVNPVRWAVLQSDSDDSGRDLVSVFASFVCEDRTWYVSSCEVTGDAEDPNDYVDHAVSAAPLSGLLSVDLSPSYRWLSRQYDGFRRKFVLSTVPVDVLTCEVETLQGLAYREGLFVAPGYEGTPPEDVSVFVISVDFGPYSVPGDGEIMDLPIDSAEVLDVSGIGSSSPQDARCDLRARRVVYQSSSGLQASPVFLTVEGSGSGSAGVLHVRTNPASFDWSAPVPKLSLASETASGAFSVQTVAMSCLSGLFGRLDSLSASFGCGSGRWSTVWIPSSSVRAVSTVGIDVLPPGSYALGIDLPVTYGQFVFKGSDYDRLTAAVSTTCDIVLSLPHQGETLYYAESANDVAGFFNGDVRVGAVRHFINSSMGFRLESREELTSQDPGGPDIVCTFSIVSGGGDFLVLDSVDAGGLVSSQIVDLSCLHADSVEHVSLSASCPPEPGLSLETLYGDGTQEVQSVDLSCLVPPVFDGTENGLVPASGAVQNYLLAGDGTWMRPVSSAEIDALFAE